MQYETSMTIYLVKENDANDNNDDDAQRTKYNYKGSLALIPNEANNLVQFRHFTILEAV